jgi:AraC-like DNA-binding protein
MMTSGQQFLGTTWNRLGISRVDDLMDAVHGAGMDAIQMSTNKLSGSLIFAEQNGVVYSSGVINGHVALRGPLSSNTLTVGVVLRLEGVCRHWLREVNHGAVGVFHGGDEHDAFYTPGVLYATATLSTERLELEAAKDDLVLDRGALGGTRVHTRPMSPKVITALEAEFTRVHSEGRARADVGAALLTALIGHLARKPYDHERCLNTHVHAKIVERARGYILANLAEPIALDHIAAAACTSRRTLFRAFADIFDDTPQSYVRRLRLHRIRQCLASEGEKACTIAIVANEWGISELGRLSGWYREMFGELPSETLATARSRLHSGNTTIQ